MLNYLDSFFSCLLPDNINRENIINISIESIKTINDNCNVIAFSFFENLEQEDNLSGLLEHCCSKANNVFVFLSEVPSDCSREIAENLCVRFNNLHLFCELVPNYKSNIKTYITWFMNTKNFYAESSWAKDDLKKLTHSTNKEKFFDCLLGSKRNERDKIEELYSSSENKNNIIFSYYKNDIASGYWDFDIKNSHHSGDKIVIDNDITSISNILPISVYNNSFYSIVSETASSNNFSFFTEKTAKPIVAKRPFIVFSGKHYLKNLRKLGFQTFNNVVDESYDDIDDIDLRFKKAWGEVERLCSRSPHDVMSKLSTVLEYNYNHFINTNWSSTIKEDLLIAIN